MESEYNLDKKAVLTVEYNSKFKEFKKAVYGLC